MKNNRN